MKRYRDDFKMDSPYIGEKYEKKNTEITETRTLSPKKNTKNVKITKTNKKNDLKGGSVLENNHQEQNNRFITKARILIDNV